MTVFVSAAPLKIGTAVESRDARATTVVAGPSPLPVATALITAPIAGAVSVSSEHGLVVAIEQQGQRGAPGPRGEKGSGTADLTYTAGAVISGETALEFTSSGTVVPANPNRPRSGWIYAGIALAAAQPGQAVDVRIVGDISAAWWTWTFGLPIFVGSNGALTQQPPNSGFSQTIGFAIGATTIRLSDEDLIFLET